MAAVPGLVVFLIVMSMNLIGDGVRDAIDPRPPAGARGQGHAADGGTLRRALAAGARIVVLDEPVSAPDVSVQAQVLRLLANPKARHGLTYVFISHDLAVVEAISDRVVVMSAGEVVEEGTPERLFADPKRHYTRRLVASVPSLAF